jgi:hydroxymethylpyrimidine/phosphomethylpyrimidine kinase
VNPPVALTVAGSDPSGGAGLQADLKTFAAFDVYGAAVVTCLTAQNTVGVREVVHLTPEFVRAQLDAVLDDIVVGAMKTGMLGTAGIVAALAAAIAARPAPLTLVVDPVMIATSGDALVEPDAILAIRSRLLPLAALATPNLPEAAALAGRPVEGPASVREAARAIRDLGVAAVLVKGGHAAGPATDLLLDGDGFHEFTAERLDVGALHGGGCSLSAAIVAGLASGRDLREAIGDAKAWTWEAIRVAPAIGRGARPLDHRLRPRAHRPA